MNFEQPLIHARFIKRYKRFLADVTLEGDDITVHCPNTGSMRHCLVEKSACWLSLSTNPKRKYAYTWELATTQDGDIACINTHRANQVVAHALEEGRIPELQAYQRLRREVTYGQEGSRIDFLLERESERCFLEVKSVTLKENDAGFFPDAKSLRAQKHLRELMQVKQQGDRAVLLFCVLNSGINDVSPAKHIDPEYTLLLQQAYKQGVECLAYKATITTQGIYITERLSVNLFNH